MKNGKLFGLQLFAEAVAGKKIVYLYRILSTEKDHDATALAFTTENERTLSKDADSTVTKRRHSTYTGSSRRRNHSIKPFKKRR